MGWVIYKFDEIVKVSGNVINKWDEFFSLLSEEFWKIYIIKYMYKMC